MKSYLLKRLSQTALVFVLVSIFAFCIVYFAPGDPLYLYTSPSVSTYKMSDEQLESMRASMGLSGNVFERYTDWAGKMLEGDWGLSTSNHQPVKEQILARLPNTMGLMGAALVLSILLSIPLGLIAGYFKDRLPDNVVSLLSYIGISVPPFWFAIMLIILFSLVLGVLPSSGMRTIGVEDPLDVVRHAILPVIVLSVGNTATFVRYLRSGVITQMHEEYVTVAKAQGASRRQLLTRHVLRNSILPLITMAGMNFGSLITGSFIVESVFGWPGIGVLCMDAVNNRDYTMIMGITMLASCLLLIGNLLADVLYALVDPRIRMNGGSDE